MAGGQAARNQTVELLRIVGCLLIIALHAGVREWRECYAGLTIFLILAAYFQARSGEPPGPGRLAMKLMLPWGLAMAGFGALNLLRHRPLLAGPGPVLGVFYGTSAHLWFLPYAFTALVVIGALGRWPATRLVLALAVGSLAFVQLALHGTSGLPPPLWQYLEATGPVCLGVLLAALGPRPGALRALAVCALAFALARFVHAGGVGYGLGLAAVVLALEFPMPWRVQAVSRHMYEVYLIHPLGLSAAHALGIEDWPAAIVAFAASIAAVVAAAAALERLGPAWPRVRVKSRSGEAAAP